MFGLAREAARLHIRSLVVVHFFSGFRRPGDIHEIVDQHVLRTGTHIFTISVDLCMQRQNADLATPAAARWWVARIQSGQDEEDRHAKHSLLPDPLMMVAHDHCVQLTSRRDSPGLTQREWAQVQIGDKLLRFLIEVLLALAANGYSCNPTPLPAFGHWKPSDA